MYTCVLRLISSSAYSIDFASGALFLRIDLIDSMCVKKHPRVFRYPRQSVYLVRLGLTLHTLQFISPPWGTALALHMIS